MPGLKQLLGQHLQLLWIDCCFDRAIHPLNIELLSDTQTDRFFNLAISKIYEVFMQKAAEKNCFS